MSITSAQGLPAEPKQKQVPLLSLSLSLFLLPLLSLAPFALNHLTIVFSPPSEGWSQKVEMTSGRECFALLDNQ